MLSYCKIKVVSLGDEAHRIRKDEVRWLRRARASALRLRSTHPHHNTFPTFRERSDFSYRNFFGLQEHRIKVVKRECRHATIAYAFLRGREYASVERFAYTQPDWELAEKIARDFSGDSTWVTKKWYGDSTLDPPRPYFQRRESVWSVARGTAWEAWLKRAKDHFWHSKSAKELREFELRKEVGTIRAVDKLDSLV